MIAELANSSLFFGRTNTGPDGSYQFVGLRPDDYKIQVRYGTVYQWQWAPQVHDRSAASVIAVGSNTEQIVEVTMLRPVADVAITVIDRATKQPVAQGCVEVAGRRDCSPTAGQFHLTELPLGETPSVVHPEPTHWPVQQKFGLYSGPNAVTVQVDRAHTIRTRLVDAAAPTNGVRGCIYPVPDTFAGRLPAPPPPPYTPAVVQPTAGSCAAADGTVVVGPLATGSVNLFVMPQAPYGAQWVGALGGTGDQRFAKSVSVAGDTAIPAIKVDRGGTIQGSISYDPTGCVSPVGTNAHSVRIPIVFCSNDGSYRLANLGPYEWPLYFYRDFGAAAPYQPYLGTWYGPAVDRYHATPVKVTAGQVSTINGANFSRTGTLVISAPAGNVATLDIYDPITDLLAHNQGSSYQIAVEAPLRKVMLRYADSAGHDCWVTTSPPSTVRRLRSNPILDLSGYSQAQIIPDIALVFGTNCRPGIPIIDRVAPPRRVTVPGSLSALRLTMARIARLKGR